MKKVDNDDVELILFDDVDVIAVAVLVSVRAVDVELVGVSNKHWLMTSLSLT